MNKKVSLLISVFCFIVVVTIIVYSFFEFRDTNMRGDEGLNPQKNEPNTNITDKDNFSEVTLTWDIVPNAKSYNIYWSHKPGVTKKTGYKIDNVNPPFIFYHAKRGLSYYFVVTTINESGESVESKEISFKVRK